MYLSMINISEIIHSALISYKYYDET
jgi:hypothetical protein